jgi:hypothetical protein
VSVLLLLVACEADPRTCFARILRYLSNHNSNSPRPHGTNNMSAVKDLASAVQQCFAIYSLPADLNRNDVAFIGEIGGQLQPILLRLKKAALQCPEDVAADTELAAATGEQASVWFYPA